MRKKNSFAPQLESLDSRLVPAGNITAQLSSGDLALTGDALGNEVRVSQNAAGDVVVRGLNGTTVNGVTQVVYRGVALNKFEANLEGGNDALTVANLRTADGIYVNLAAGNDRMVMNGAISGNVIDVNKGTGTDSVRGQNTTVIGDVNVIADGQTTAVFDIASIDGNLNIATKDFADTIRATRLTVFGDLYLETGKGDDVINLSNTTVGFNLTANTDEGIDRITFNTIRAGGDVSVEAGKGNDIVTMTTVSSDSSVKVNTDDGNDRVTATRVSARVDAIFVGGAGTDVLDDNGIIGGVKKEVVEFESVI